MLPFLMPLIAGLTTWAPVIGAGISAVGGLMSASARQEAENKPVTTTNTIDLAKLRADAEANGFNPLTVMRNGGLAGYGTSTTPQFSGTSPAGEFMQGIGGMFGAFSEVRRNETEYSLAQAQIQNYNADTKAKSMMLRPPTYTASRQQVGSGLAAPKNVSPGTYKIWGYDMEMNPKWSSAEDLEAWHGDAADLFAPARFNDDLIYNAPRMVNDFKNWVGGQFAITKSDGSGWGIGIEMDKAPPPRYRDSKSGGGVSYDNGKTYVPLPK